MSGLPPEPWSLRINSAGRTLCDTNWKWDTSKATWTDLDLWTVFRGRGHLIAPEGEMDLIPGDCLVLRGGQSYMLTQDLNDCLGVTHIHFDLFDADNRMISATEWQLPLHRQLDDLPFFDRLMQRVVLAHRTDGRSREADAWLRAALYEIDAQDRRPGLTGLQREQFGRIEALSLAIVERPGHRWRVADMARHCRYSPDHFSRLFRDFKGCGPQEYVMKARVDRARELLLNGDQTVAEIAEHLGFADVHHFSKQFRRYTGDSPGNYRRRLDAIA